MRKPFFKKSHKAWFVHHEGRMLRLAAEKAQAFQRYHELMAAHAPASVSDTVASLANSFLQWCEGNRSSRTYEWYRDFLSSFIRSIGTRLRIGTLQPLHVTKWLSGETGWNSTTRNSAVRAVKRVFNWAIREGRLLVSPLRNLERPRALRREGFVTKEQFQAILAAVSDKHFEDYLTFLHETGARPQEIKLIEARHCDLAARRVVLPSSQSKGHRFPRVIYFTDRLDAMMSRLCAANPIGEIFRNRRNVPWVRSSINCRFKRLRKKLRARNATIEGLCATAFRHGFATEALKNGVDPVTVSILMGHQDTTQVARTYQHLAADPQFLAQALRKATMSKIMTTP